MYFHVYLIYRFTRTFTDHSSVITRCWVFELQNGQSSLKSLQTLAAQSFAPASFLSTHSKRSILRDTPFLFSKLFCDSCTETCSFAYFQFYADSWGREKTALSASPIQEEMELERFLSLPVGWWSQAEN